MSEQFRGKVEIQNSNGSGVAIVLDGDAKPQAGSFTVTDPDDPILESVAEGDHFITGQIDIKDIEGNIQLSLLPLASADATKGSGWIKVNRGGIILMDDKRKQPGASDTRIRLNASSGSIRIEGAAGETLAIPGMLRMDNGRLRLGSEANGDGNTDGSLRLRNAAGETTVLLLADDGSLSLRNQQGETTVQLRSSGLVEINDITGDVLVVPGMLRLVEGRLRIGGKKNVGGTDGSLRLRDAKGTLRMQLDATDGRLRLRNAEGQETMHLDGNKGDLILQNADCAEDFDIATNETISAACEARG